MLPQQGKHAFPGRVRFAAYIISLCKILLQKSSGNLLYEMDNRNIVIHKLEVFASLFSGRYATF